MIKITSFVLLFIVAAVVSIHAQADIHKVDFQNFTYKPYCAGEDAQNVTVKKGEFAKETKMDGYVDHFYFNILGVEYGDLTGDKQDEAVVLSVCNTGGTGQFTEGFIYTIKGGKPVLLARVPGGDRAEGGLRSLTVENGHLVVDANDGSADSGACCPEYAIRSTYRLSGDKLLEVGKGVRRALYPAETLAFDRGAFGKTFSVTVGTEDRKRYTLGARAGQTLTVSVNMSDASLRLLGDTDAVEGKNSISAKLPKSGDYTFEISNYSDKPIQVTVTVSIK
jgi:hypothetical protein